MDIDVQLLAGVVLVFALDVGWEFDGCVGVLVAEVVSYLDFGVDVEFVVETGGCGVNGGASGPFFFSGKGDGSDHLMGSLDELGVIVVSIS